MTIKIIDDVEQLMTLSEDDLDQVLLDEKYNKQNLRELVRRTLKKTNEYKKAFEYEKSEDKKETDRLLQQYQNDITQ